MNVFLTGGTGFVGSLLVQALLDRGHEVTVLTRSSAHRPRAQGLSYLEADPVEKGSWQKKVADHDAVINMAGASIFTRWTDRAKQRIRDSRILTTRNLVEGLSSPKGRGRLLISTSAVGYYGFHGDEVLDETSPPGDDFLATLARDWEATALEAQRSGVRVVLTRFGIVLGNRGGALSKMIPLFRRRLGSPLGSGRQWFSWIHQQDLAAVYLFLLDHPEAEGPVNCTAPNPVRNRELTALLGKTLGKDPFLPPVPGFMVRAVLGEFGSILLQGQRVLPGKLLEMGFRFRFPELEPALEDLLNA